jgi:hypothetical protein
LASVGWDAYCGGGVGRRLVSSVAVAVERLLREATEVISYNSSAGMMIRFFLIGTSGTKLLHVYLRVDNGRSIKPN